MKNPLTLLALGLIKGYRLYLSPLKGHGACRFYPTCSAYALEAFQKYGFLKASRLTLWRILRCQPLSKGGYDPVP